MLRLGVPLLFVLIWSTGFIVAKAVVPHADLQWFLVARFFLTALVMGCAALIAGAQWPGVRRAAPHVLAGALMQGIYLCASYWAISRGLAAGVMSLLGALQPLFTALLAVSVMGRTLQPRAWAGLLIGFAGVGLVLGEHTKFRRGDLRRSCSAVHRDASMGRGADSVGCTCVGGLGAFRSGHDLAHVDDASWRGDESDGAAAAGSSAGGGPGVSVFR